MAAYRRNPINEARGGSPTDYGYGDPFRALAADDRLAPTEQFYKPVGIKGRYGVIGLSQNLKQSYRGNAIKYGGWVEPNQQPKYPRPQPGTYRG